ncbi:hypothetical protein M426DRAFT_267180 [Hypoxylon sp. CI-4A]|nr:hypothetical protein M426DRAFT_267180 [Hypoxylon sp. CI-4A]
MAFIIAWALQTILIDMIISTAVTLNETAAFTAVAALDIATDLMLMVLPLRPLIALQIRTSHRIALILIFSAGLILNWDDLSYTVVQDNYLNIIQPGIAVMVACSPLLKPISDRALGSSPRGTRYGGSQFKSVSRLVNTRNKGKLGNSRATGFEELSDSEQQLRVELGNLGTEQTQVQVQGNSCLRGNQGPAPAATCSADRIVVTRQTVVASA